MGFLKSWRRLRTLEQNRIANDSWQRIIQERPLFEGLTVEEIDRLRDLATLFIAEKDLHGAAGQEIDENVRLTIAAQACLPILNLGIDYYNGWVEVIVYPDQF